MVDNRNPSSEDISAQAAAMKQLAAVLAQLVDVRAKDNKAAREQTDIGKEMNDVLGEIEKKRKKEEEDAAKRLKALEEEIDNIDDLNGAMKFLIKNLKEKYKASKSLAVGLAAAAGAMKGFQQGMKMTMSLLSGLGGILQSVIGGLFDIGIAILTGPIKMFNALFSKAKDAMGSGTEVAQAIEKIRENFGDVSTGLGKNVKDMGTALTQGLIAPGLRSMQVFGNLAEAMNYVNELAAAAPAQFQALQGQIKTNTKEILSMAKGLGIAKEDFQGLMNAAISSGTPLIEIEKDMTKYAKGMAKEFGLDSKMISRDMGRAMKDVKHFANVSVKELAKATTYAHGLGLELKDITGVLDAFNTFDQAAENVAKLSQAFGVNIDTMKLLEAKTPDDALDQIKQAFTAAGKSADKMNRQELQLIASSVGMDEAAVRQALSTKNAGISMQRAKSASAALEGQTMSTAQAMQVLSKDIEKMVKSAEPPKGENFFEVFFEGFAQGVERTAEFRGVLQNLMKSIWVVRQAGVELGEAFVKSFPGFRDVLGGLADILAPDKIGGLFKSFANTLKEFFASLKDGSMSVETLFKKLQKNVMDYFTAAGPGGQKFLNGLSDMWKAAKFIIVGALDYIGDMLKDGLTRMADYLDNGLDKGINSLAGGVMGEASPIIDAFVRLYEKVKDPILRVINKAFRYLVEKAGEFFEEHWWDIAKFMLGPSIIMGVGQAFASASVMLIMQGIIGPWLKKLVGAAGAATSEDFKALGKSMDGLRDTLQAGVGTGRSATELNSIEWGKAKASILKFAGFATVAVVAIAALIGLVKVSNLSQNELIALGVLVVSVAVMMVAAGAAVKMTESVEVDKGVMKRIGLIAGVVGVMLLAAAGLVGIAYLAKGLTGDAVKTTVEIVLATGLLFLEAAVIATIATYLGKLIGDKVGEAVKGAAAIGIVATVMLGAAALMIYLSKDADAAKLQGVSAILTSVYEMFLAAAVVVLASLGIGLLLAGPLVLAALAGFGAITTVVAGMAATATVISGQINDMKVADPAAFLLKTIAVSTIMDSITRMVLAVSEVIKSIPPNISSDSGRLKDLSTMITGMLAGIEGIIKQVVAAVQAIGASDSALKAASSLANVIAAVAEIAKALSPGDLKEIYKNIDDDDFDEVPKIIAEMSKYAQTVSEALLGKGDPRSDGILKAVESLAKTAAGWKEEDVPKIEALAKVLGTLAPMLDALKLPPELGPALAEATKNYFGPNAKDILASAAKFIEKVSPKFEKLIGTVMGKFPDLIKALAGINFTESQAKSIDSFMPVLKIALETATGMARSALSWAGTAISKEDMDKLSAKGGVFDQAATGLEAMMNKMAEKFPGFVTAISDAVKNITVDPAVVGKMKALTDLFKFFGEFMGFFKTMKTAITEDKGSEFAGRLTQEEVDSYVNNIGSMAIVLDRVLGEEALGSGNFQHALTNLNTLGEKIAGYKTLNVDKIKGVFETITTVMTTLKTVKDMKIGEMMAASGGGGADANTPADAPAWQGPAAPAFTELEVIISQMSQLLNGLASNETGLASLKEPMDKVNKIFEKKEFSTSFRNAAININTFNSAAGALKTAIEKLPDITPESVTGKTKPIKSTLDALVSEINSLNGVITADLEGKLALKGGKMELTVKKAPNVAQKPININVTFNAILDVADVGKGLVKSKNLVATRIEQLAIRAGVSEGYSAVNDVPRPPTK